MDWNWDVDQKVKLTLLAQLAWLANFSPLVLIFKLLPRRPLDSVKKDGITLVQVMCWHNK